MSRNHIKDEDEGKKVVDGSGQMIGMVTEVKSGTAYVNADPGLADSIRSTLGWNEADQDDYPLDGGSIDTITDDEIHLKDSF